MVNGTNNSGKNPRNQIKSQIELLSLLSLLDMKWIQTSKTLEKKPFLKSNIFIHDLSWTLMVMLFIVDLLWILYSKWKNFCQIFPSHSNILTWSLFMIFHEGDTQPFFMLEISHASGCRRTRDFSRSWGFMAATINT